MKMVIRMVVMMVIVKLICRCVFDISMGSMNLLENIFDCGKFMLLGFFSGLLMVYISSSCVI